MCLLMQFLVKAAAHHIVVDLSFISLLHVTADPEGGMSPLPVRKDSGGKASFKLCVALNTV